VGIELSSPTSMEKYAMTDEERSSVGSISMAARVQSVIILLLESPSSYSRKHTNITFTVITVNFPGFFLIHRFIPVAGLSNF
jgi:hypothetical protein